MGFLCQISLWYASDQIDGKAYKKPLDVHLMIVEPDRYIQTFADLGADVLTVHVEACTHLHRSLQSIKLRE